MEHLKSYYTIEKHLAESSRHNNQFEILNAIWQLNKRNLSSALTSISQYYPHYSLHEQSHSNTIINNIESFLGEERIKNLSPTNAWLILMAAYTHDLGMIVFHDLIEKQWLSDDFQEFLKDLSDSSDEDLKKDAQILLKVQNISDVIDYENFSIGEVTPIRIRNCVTKVVAEYIRKIHHQRSSDIIKGSDKTFFEIANSFYSNQIPNRLLNVLGEVAYLHGVNFYEIFKRLEYKSNGISSDKINPRFIACLLRLGDLLDVDDKRFNTFSEKTFEFPISSKNHKEKHSSIKHLLINPEGIEITSVCPTEEVYRLARNWFDWLQEEVENQSREWSNIAPEDLGGSSPTIPKGKIRVYYKNTDDSQLDDRLLNLRFEVSSQKIFEILEGGSIYDKAELTFIRELVQNALDASKIQLWEEIERGTFDFVLKKHFKDTNLEHDALINKIKFPDNIPDTLYNSFEVNLKIDWKDDAKEILVFQVSDKGTGISDEALIRMTNKVGQSRKQDIGYKQFLDRMPFWLKPTGAFGIGLQSVFIIADKFVVETKVDGEVSKEIIFRSAKKGKYSSLGKNQPQMQRGTRVSIEVPKNKFPEIFGTSFSWNIIGAYDYFSDKHKSIYIPKIRLYVEEILRNIGTLKVDFFGENILGSSSDDLNYKIFTPIKSEDNSVQCSLKLRDNDLFFHFYEKHIGTEFIIRFITDFDVDLSDQWTKRENVYFVREIPVKSNIIQYHKLMFSKLYWNFMSPESDKILSLTREKFIKKKQKELEKEFFQYVTPLALKLMSRSFADNKEGLMNFFSESRQSLAYGYFKMLLTLEVNGISSKSLDDEIIGNECLSIDMVETLESKPVGMKDFFDYKKVIVPVFGRNMISNKNINTLKKQRVSEICEEKDSKTLVFWNNDFFTTYIQTRYNISEIYFWEDGYILILETSSSETIQIKKGEEVYMNRLVNSQGLLGRGWYYASKKYKSELAIKNNYASGFEHFPYLSDLSIVSPFKNFEHYLKIKSEIKDGNLVQKLTDDYLLTFISDLLIDWVIKYKPAGIERSKSDVLNGYRKLIMDLINKNI